MQGDWKGEIVWIKNLRKRGKADETIPIRISKEYR